MSANMMSLARSGGKFLKLFGDRKMMKTMPTARDYVQDGLIAMWDGIENAGWGVHDPNATTWTDLIGTHDADVPTGAFDMISFDLSKVAVFDFTEPLTRATVEIFGNITTIFNDSGGMFFGLTTNKICIGRYNSIIISSVHGGQWGNKQFILPTPYPNSISISFMPNDKEALFDGIVPSTSTETWTTAPRNSFIGSNRNVGRLYSVRVYDRNLFSGEKLKNYAIDKARFNLTTPTI